MQLSALTLCRDMASPKSGIFKSFKQLSWNQPYKVEPLYSCYIQMASPNSVSFHQLQAQYETRGRNQTVDFDPAEMDEETLILMRGNSE